jgi:purine-binding chemotaxis protein CheW
MDPVQQQISQYLTFRLRDESFALEICKVREVLDFTSVTKVPRTPDYMTGVINLREGVVPVVDMRTKFGIPPAEKTVNTCIIIVEVVVDDDGTVIGAMVDAVQEVLELDSSQIEPPPQIGSRLKTDLIKGMGKRDEQFIMILDMDRVFSRDEMLELEATNTQTSGILA